MRSVVSATSRAPIKGTSSAISDAVAGCRSRRPVWMIDMVKALYCPSQCHSAQRSQKAKQIVRDKVDRRQRPLPLLEISHGFESEAGKRSERATESDHDEQTPAWIEQHALAGPDHKEANDKAAAHVDEQCSIWKYWA